MNLVQILLPVYDKGGARFPRSDYAAVRDELVAAFGGLTAYARAPASGFWKDDADEVTRDDVVVYEVMVDVLDRTWWSQYRRQLEVRFSQDEIIVRACLIDRL